MLNSSPVNQTTKEYPLSGIPILPIYCLILSMRGFFAQDAAFRVNLVLKESSR